MELNTIHQGDALNVLKTLDPESVDCIVTSPPYYGLRDYGVGGQIGQEKTPQQYIENLMKIFDECKRVLKKTGSCWVNIGDSYGGTGSKGNHKDPKYRLGRNGQSVSISAKLSPKSLLAIPERFVIAMSDSGWIRRNTIIWHKPNCMPSSAKDRFTVDFEYFYFFTKSKKYYFETQYEPHKDPRDPEKKGSKRSLGSKNLMYNLKGQRSHSFHQEGKIFRYDEKGRLKRSVWKITLQPFKDAHFAVFPEKLVETPIRACCPPPPNGVVLDPFMGSGTVGVVAKKQGKNYMGIELNPDYIEIAKRRIPKTTPTFL